MENLPSNYGLVYSGSPRQQVPGVIVHPQLLIERELQKLAIVHLRSAPIDCDEHIPFNVVISNTLDDTLSHGGSQIIPVGFEYSELFVISFMPRKRGAVDVILNSQYQSGERTKQVSYPCSQI